MRQKKNPSVIVQISALYFKEIDPQSGEVGGEMLLNPPPLSKFDVSCNKNSILWSFLLLSCFYPCARIILAGTITMASILDQYEEESARATSLSTVTPLQVPVSSHNCFQTLVQNTFTICYDHKSLFSSLYCGNQIDLVLFSDWSRLH